LIDTQAVAYGNNTTPKSTASMTWIPGDIIVVVGNTEGSTSLTTPTFGGGTFTAIGSALTTGSYCWGYAWQCTVAAGGSGAIESTKPATAQWWGMRAWQYRNHRGLGNVGRTQPAAGTATSSITTTAGSAVCGVAADFNAIAAGKTGTPTVNAEYEDTQHASHYTVWSADWANQGAASTGYGVTVGTGHKFTFQFLEILDLADTVMPRRTERRATSAQLLSH
jgi:hypothetical protein